MATIKNTEARLLNGPPIHGHKPPQWLPGKNPIDPAYWAIVKVHGTIKRWLALGWIIVDLDEESADPKAPPSAEELAGFTRPELASALTSPNVPVQWHPALEAELAKRDDVPEPAPSKTRKKRRSKKSKTADPVIEVTEG